MDTHIAREPAPAAAPPSPWRTVAGAVALFTAAVAVLLTAFAWPLVRSSLHDVPIAVAGPPAAVGRVGAALDRRLPGGFAITEAADTAAAELLIREREVYGAIDVGSGRPQVVTASAAGPAIAQALQGVAAAGPGRRGGSRPRPRAFARRRRPGSRTGRRRAAPGHGRAARRAGADAAGPRPGPPRRRSARLRRDRGLAVAGILQFRFGSLEGPYAANAAAVALAVAAVSLSLIGLESVLGYAGFGIGSAVMVLVGNPLSGASTAPEMLPGWPGGLGRLLPPGAGAHLLRSTAFFDGRGAAPAAMVLAAWLALGATLCLAAALRAGGRGVGPATGPPAG
ncbi:ABC transporter permease [Streptomyces globosus]|uniref:ABC transporter permease n=1 Tax=Streptomyces globosus TaxID=68209 RepID=UPI00362C973C